MKYMLDTNICIYLIKKEPEQVLKRFKSCKSGDICISTITLAELMYGVEKSLHSQKNKNALEEFISPLEIMPFDQEATTHYGHIRSWLEKNRTPIGPLDLMIAAHAKSLHTILVTNNKREFARVPKLRIEDWSLLN